MTDHITANNDGQILIACAASRAWLNKLRLPGFSKAQAESFSFVSVKRSLVELVDHILAGGSFTHSSFTEQRRKTELFVSSQMIVLDFDSGMSVADLKALPFMRDYAWLIYATPSSTIEQPRSRVVFILDQSITDAKQWQRLARGWYEHFKTLLTHIPNLNIDRASYSPAHKWAGSTNRIEEPYINHAARLPIALIPEYVEQKPTRISVGQGDISSDVLTAIEQTLSISQYKSDGWSLPVACPFKPHEHDSLAPAGAWHRDKHIFYCQKCQRQWLAKDTAGALGIKWPQALPRLKRTRKNRSNNPPTGNIITDEPEPYSPVKLPHNRMTGSEWGIGSWKNGLPTGVISVLLNYAPNGAALIVHIVNEAVNKALIDPQCWTREELYQASQDLGYVISPTTFNAYMKALEDEQERTGKGLFFRILGSIYVNKLPKNGINSKKAGRPRHEYRLLSPEDQRQGLLDLGHYRLWEVHHPTEDGRGRHAVISNTHQSMIDGLDTIEDKNALALELAGEIDAIAQAQGDHLTNATDKYWQEMNEFSKALDDDTTLELPTGEGWLITNVADYIVAFTHAYTKTVEGEKVSIKQWTKVLGISDTSVPKYLKRAGVGRIDLPNRKIVTIQNTGRIISEVQEKAAHAKGYPLFITAHNKEGLRTHKVRYRPEMAEKTVTYWERQGFSVNLTIQVANAYEVVSQERVEIEKQSAKRPSVTKQPVKRNEPKFEFVKPFRERRFNPVWVAGQFRLVLEKKERRIGEWLFKDQGGNIIETKDPRKLAELIIGRSIASNDLHRAIESEMAVAGWQKVSA